MISNSKLLLIEEKNGLGYSNVSAAVKYCIRYDETVPFSDGSIIKTKKTPAEMPARKKNMDKAKVLLLFVKSEMTSCGLYFLMIVPSHYVNQTYSKI